MKLSQLLPVTVTSLVLIAGCSDLPSSQNTPPATQGTQAQVTPSTDSKIHIVTSFYPLAELAERVGGDAVEVKNLVPPGAEPHDFEPSPKDILALNTADLVMVNGIGFEPWAEKVLPMLESKGVKVLDVSKIIPELLKPTEPADQEVMAEEGDKNEEEHFAYDPHFWLDPIMYMGQAKAVGETLSRIQPENATDFKKNTDAYIAQLQDLDAQFTAGLKSCTLHEIVTNHAAFGYLAKRYNLTMLPISGLSPDSEPSAKRLGELTELVKKDGVKIIFTESLLSPKVSETLAKEAGVQTMVLNPLEGLTADEIKAGENYISVMEKNLESLGTALECT
jgi:zinc transport system substrate-binding protein